MPQERPLVLQTAVTSHLSIERLYALYGQFDQHDYRSVEIPLSEDLSGRLNTAVTNLFAAISEHGEFRSIPVFFEKNGSPYICGVGLYTPKDNSPQVRVWARPSVSEDLSTSYIINCAMDPNSNRRASLVIDDLTKNPAYGDVSGFDLYTVIELLDKARLSIAAQ